MNMFIQFEPKTLIRGIRCAKTTNRELTAREISLLQEKLLQAENNPDILRLARGDGRKIVLDEILADDKIIFGWGLKSQHSFHARSSFRDLLEPEQVQTAGLKKLVGLYENNLAYHYGKEGFRSFHHARLDHAEIVQQLYAMIENEQTSREDLLLIKDWLCMMLHTAGCIEFKDISPWVSAALGVQRYKTAYLFGRGQRFDAKWHSKRSYDICRRYVIFDTWIACYDEHHAFERTQFLIDRLDQMGLPWYPDRNHEIMLKYAIYPQNLIGYYYFENDCLCYYYVNPHYFEHMLANPEFQIGDYVFIDQAGVDFPANNPYRMIYTRHGNKFSIYKRR